MNLARGSDYETDDEASVVSPTLEAVAAYFEAAAANAEAAGVTLGMFVVGGLGMAGAAVFGAGQLS